MWLKSLAAVITVLVALRYAKYDDVIPPLTKTLNASYDYVIVGAGSAGCVLANRLSADSDVTVLLIEAGPDDRGREDIALPAAAPQLHHSDVDWDYVTVPQSKMEGHNYKQDGNMALNVRWKDTFIPDCGFQQVSWSAGRVLGGSSSVNYMQYVRGHRLDYEQWAAAGCEGWSYQDVLPYYIKSERLEDVDHVNTDYHGQNGPLRVEVVKLGLKLTDVILKAAAEMGLKIVDNNADVGEGISYTQQTSYKGQRSSTSRAFLHPALTRPNLHVAVNSVVTKVLFDKKRAVGVELVRKGRKLMVQARREVILSAGAIGSSKLLLLSGVGPKEHLRSKNITVVADLPVGENLHDHLLFDYHVTLDQPLGLTKDDFTSWWSRLKLKLFGTGPLTTVGEELQMFVSTSALSQQQGWPDVQIFLLSLVWDSTAMSVFVRTEQALRDISARDNLTNGFVCLPIVLRPKSRGTLRLDTSDPFQMPLMDPKYLTHPDDLETLLRGVSVCQKLIQTRSLQEVGARPTDLPSSTCSEQGTRDTSDPEYWRCLISRNAHTVAHYSGTCKMGAASDVTAVVDPQLRVRGLDGLRVVDASIFPFIPSGNTNAAVIMVAEKASDVIRQTRHKGT